MFEDSLACYVLLNKVLGLGRTPPRRERRPDTLVPAASQTSHLTAANRGNSTHRWLSACGLVPSRQ